MSAEGSTGPSMEQMMALIRASQGQGGSGCAPILMGLRDVEFTTLSAKTGGLPFDKPFAPLVNAPQGGLFARLCKSLGFTPQEIAEGFKKANDAGALRQINSSADIGHGLGGGQTFAAMVSGGSTINDEGGRGA